MEFVIEAVNISDRRGIQKHEIAKAEIVAGFGIEGDAHAGHEDRQISFLAGEAIDKMKAKGLSLEPGAFAENVVTRGMDWRKARVGGRIVINNEIELEITHIGKQCHQHCAIYQQAGECIMPVEGIFARVIRGGKIRAQNRGYYSFG